MAWEQPCKCFEGMFTPENVSPESNLDETTRQIKFKVHSAKQPAWTLIHNVKVRKDRKRLGNCSELQETKET